MAAKHDHPFCRELVSQLSDYVDGELDAAVCAELEAHLAECSNCRVMVDTIRKTITLYHAQAPVELPDEVEKRLYKALKLED